MEEEIKLSEIFQLFKKKIRLLTYLSLTFLCIVVIWLSLSQDQYTSKAIVSLNSNNPSLQNSEGGLQGISRFSSLIGINTNSNEVASDYQIAYKKIQSRFFIEQFLNSKDIKIKLLGGEIWSDKSDDFIINKEAYDQEKQEWKIRVPDNYKLYKEFIKKFKISKDGNSGFIEISFKSESPQLSKYITEEIIFFLNTTMSDESLESANSNLKFLKNEIAKERFIETKLTLSNLIEVQLKKKMFSLNSDEFIFRVIDPPLVPLEKTSPKRILIFISSLFIFFFLFSFFLVVSYIFKRKKL